MDEADFKAGLTQWLNAITRLPRSELGYQGEVHPFRLGVYAEGRTPESRILVADPAEVALGRLAWREWATWRDGKFGGRQAVKPGGNPLGGIGVAGLIGMVTGLPISQAIVAPATHPEARMGDQELQDIVMTYLRNKARSL